MDRFLRGGSEVGNTKSSAVSALGNGTNQSIGLSEDELQSTSPHLQTESLYADVLHSRC